MYHSGMTVSNVLDIVAGEVDIVGRIDASSYCRWISSLEGLIYADILSEERVAEVKADQNGVIPLSLLPVGTGERIPIFDDILKVYRCGDELTRVGLAAFCQFGEDKALYYKNNDGELAVSVYGQGQGDTYLVLWRAIPTVKQNDGEEILLPYEWLDLLLAKLRGEAYKIANDDAQAAKWLGDYNTQMESFRLWAAERRKRYGE